MTETDSKTSETSPEEAPLLESPGSNPSVDGVAQTAAPEPDALSDGAGANADEPTVAPVEEASPGEASPALDPASTSQSSTDSSAGDVAADGGKKKRRRRRKKKGAQGAPSDAPDSKTGHHHAPFLHLFSGGIGRKHAFSVGEVIAGRVERIDRGAIVVDLFGKASAIVDADEPREIPAIIHQPDPRISVVPDPRHEPAPAPVAEAPAPAAEAPAPVAETPGPVAEATASVVDTPAPIAEAPAPQAANAPEDDDPDGDAWEFSPTQTSDLPYPELGEADTVVGAQAYAEPERGAAPTPFDPTVPPAEPSSSPAAAPAPETREASSPAPSMESTEEASEGEAAETASAPTAPPPEDLSDADLTLLDPLPELPAPELGAIFRGRIGGVAESGHVVIVNRDVDKAAVRKALRAARQHHQRVHGLVYGFNRGGFDVLVGGVRAFCPASAMSLTPIEDPNAFVGQRCEFSLPQDKGGKKSIIVSRRGILEKEARKRARKRMEELQVGETLHGKVLDVRDYGVLVDLGDGLDGLVHMSEVSWSRSVRPNQAAKVGDEVDVQVLKVQPATRKDRFGRVSLSMRACQPDPWDLAKDTLRPGVPVKGTVVRTTEFGAFVQIADNVEGLLHISELGGNKELTHAKQALQEGEEIDVVIERVDREQRRISLSKLSEADAKALEAGEIEVGKAPKSLKSGAHIAVLVKRVEHNGVQVQVDGVLGKRGRGFIPNRELQDVQGERRKGPAQGDVIDVKVIGIERDGTLRCSVRARLLDEERRAVRDYRKESAKQGLGTFGDLLKAKLGDSSK